MHRLVVNPNTPQAWEIQLKPGDNSLGRGDANDFKIQDPSVSSSHCCIIVAADSVVIRDLGSTNGTFINRASVQEAGLENGQSIRLGSVEMVFFSEAPATSASPPPPPPRAAMRVARPETAPTHAPDDVIVIPSAPPRPALRISGAHTAAPAPGQAEPPPAPPIAPLMAPPIPELQVGPRFCKFHPKSPARYLCNKCNRTFCELCITSRTSHGAVQKTCRSCGVPVIPLQVTIVTPTERNFYASIPGAFIYPFRGFGSVIVIFATIVFSGLDLLSSIWAKIALYGLMFLYMQNILHTTTSDENETLGFPEVDGLGGAALQLAGTVLMSFGIPIGLVVARFFDIGIPVEAIIATVILGCLYFPMAFLAVAMKDSVAAGNPLVVIPSIIKIPGPYSVASLLLVGIYGFGKLGDIVSSMFGGVTFTTRSMSTLFIAIGIQVVWAFLSLYLLTVNMRILGLMYNSKKDELGWF